MADYATLKAAIQAVIYENGNQEITGSVMQATLLTMVNSLGANYQYAGIATPSTNPDNPDQNVFYLASTAGTYVNFGNIVLEENEVAILKYNGSWTKESSGFASDETVSQLDKKVKDIDTEATESEDDGIRIETDNGAYVGKAGDDGIHAKELFVGSESDEKKVSDFLPDVPKDFTKAEGIISDDEKIIVATDQGETIGYFDGDGLKVKDIKYLNGTPIATKVGAVVDASGKGDYTTIQAAILGTQGGDTIIVMPGTYEESVDCYMKVRHIVGVCRETCILTNGTGNYDTPPLKMNAGSIRNMTIVADNYDPTIEGDPASDDFDKTQRPSYGIHVEQSMPSPFQFLIENCYIESKWSAPIGAGVRYNQTLIVRDCTLVSDGVRQWSTSSNKWVYMGGIYFHNDASVTNQNGAVVKVERCWMKGVNAGVTIQSVTGKNNGLVAEFIGCTISSDNNGVAESNVYTWGETPSAGHLAGSDITLAITSHGNNLETLNN